MLLVFHPLIQGVLAQSAKPPLETQQQLVAGGRDRRRMLANVKVDECPGKTQCKAKQGTEEVVK